MVPTSRASATSRAPCTRSCSSSPSMRPRARSCAASTQRGQHDLAVDLLAGLARAHRPLDGAGNATKLMLRRPPNHPPSRYVLVGTILKLPPEPIGIWVETSFIGQRPVAPEHKKERYNVTPPQMLVRWDAIITAQTVRADTAPEDPRPVPGQYL